MATGRCKLSGEWGVFIDAHLLPKALTKPASPGFPFVESSTGHRPRRKWSSWYDNRLVTKVGEKFLADLDNWAISELRKHHLVWSGWPPGYQLDHSLLPGTPWGVRTVAGIDPKKLRLFFLSLLWRAAATERHEFSEVVIPNEDLDIIRKMILNHDPGCVSFYPVNIIQLSTIGLMHNHTPIAENKKFLSFDGTSPKEVPIYRFYFDGLIIHFQRQSTDDGETVEKGDLIVGAADTITFPTVIFEESAQFFMMRDIVSDAQKNWPDLMMKL